MSYTIPKYITQMTARERWKMVHNSLSIQRTVFDYKRSLASCFYASGFDVVRFGVDEYGFLFDTMGEKYMLVKSHKGDKYGYIVSRFGVRRVPDFLND